MKTISFFKMTLLAVAIIAGGMSVFGQSSNLLKNADFEGGSLSPWVGMQFFDDLQNNGQTMYNTATNQVPVPNLTDAAFFTTGNGRNITSPDDSYCSGFAGRFPSNTIAYSMGMYQLVDVIPGGTYQFTVHLAYFANSPSNQLISPVVIKLKSLDGTETLGEEFVDETGTSYDLWIALTGSITVPDDYSETQARFQIMRPERSESGICGTVIDNCEFSLNTTNGLIGINADNDKIVEIHYYNLLGAEIFQPTENTICIVKKVYESQKTEVSKILFK